MTDDLDDLDDLDEYITDKLHILMVQFDYNYINVSEFGYPAKINLSYINDCIFNFFNL